MELIKVDREIIRKEVTNDKLGDFLERVSRAYAENGWRYRQAIREILEIPTNAN